jgi:hypothetical protein
MNRQRSLAYGRVTRTLRDLGPAKLQAAEQERIRAAADTLVFCGDVVRSPAARAALADISALHDQLVGSGRWSAARAGALLDDLWACGPGVPVHHALAA